MIADMSMLPELLRNATLELHAQAERTGVMGELLRGQLPRARYVALLRNLLGLYRVLEARPLPVPSLNRAGALAADLAVLHGPGWEGAVPLAASMDEYLLRLREADAPALAAHAYVRYLGDLHGGQILAGIVRRAYSLPEGRGTAFYEFGPEPAVHGLRAGLRTALAALRFGAAELERAADEARWAFAQHIRLFGELQQEGTAAQG